MSSERRRVLILGAAGRDFHNFNTAFRHDPTSDVVAFTATQIPGIDGRVYPPSLAGPLYPGGIPIVPESDLETVIREKQVDLCVFSYSDVSYATVMHLASRCTAAGSDFGLLGGRRTMLRSKVPVIAITAVRTGAGKSQTTRFVSRLLKEMGLRAVVVRHPMPYGDLSVQVAQRFAAVDDLVAERCTIEEREEYEPHIDNGFVVYAGVDYERILRRAEEEADVILWDGGNNDTPFYAPSLYICIADPHRAGDEAGYWPGEVNFISASLIVINKCDTASEANIRSIEERAAKLNPTARVVRAASPVTIEHAAEVVPSLAGKRLLVVEDGPTLTHGGMTFGAGVVAVRGLGAEIVDPSPYAVGSIAETFAKYPNARGILPAMGYSAPQIAELEETIARTPADVVVIGTPIDLRRVLRMDKPSVRVRYDLEELVPGGIEAAVRKAISDTSFYASAGSSSCAGTGTSTGSKRAVKKRSVGGS